MSVKIYTARAMSGRIKEEVVREAIADKTFLEVAGLIVLDPVTSENVEATKDVLLSSKAQMNTFWFRDKRMIEECHILFDMTPLLKSEGVSHEIGYGRYFLYKPIVRVFPSGKLPPPGSVAVFEDDFICDSLLEAIEYVYRQHGTFYKRFKWRAALYNRCAIKMIRCFFTSWK